MKAHEILRLAAAVSVSFVCALSCSSSPPAQQAAGGGGSGGFAGSPAAGNGGAAGATGGTGGTGAEDGGAGDADAGDADAGDAGSAVDEACIRLARVTCEKYGGCMPWYVLLEFGDIDTCIQQYAATQCRHRIGLEDSSESLATLEACTLARSSATCAEWFDDAPAVSACLPRPGTRVAGALCVTSSQCQSNHCVLPPGTDCGRCGAPLVEEGARCVADHDCLPNLSCISGVCRQRPGLGQSCPNADACRYGLVCWYGQCVVGTAKAGEPCDMTTACIGRDSICKSNVCFPWQFIGPGEPCGPGGTRYCMASGTCLPTEGSGICVVGAREGEACNIAGDGPFCMPWATCIQGVCKTHDPSTCK